MSESPAPAPHDTSAASEFASARSDAPGDGAIHPLALGSKPKSRTGYGFVVDGEFRACTREQLIERCSGLTLPSAVWTPEEPVLLLPGAVPYLADAIAAPTPQKTRSLPAMGMAALAALALLLGATGALQPVLGVSLAILLGLGSLALLAARRYAVRRLRERALPAGVAREMEAIRYESWVSSRPAAFTNALAGVLVAVGAFQLLGGGVEHSVEAAGLVKAEVRAGAWWRLLTAPLLHGGILHLWFNAGALVAFGRYVETHGRRVFVPLVFLVAAAAGSVASLVLLPQATSVGASGGVLGLLGFLLAVSYRDGTPLPPFMRRSLWGTVGLNAVIGLAGFWLIDNAAHAGGFVAGGVLGCVLPLTGGGDTAPERGLRRLTPAEGAACLTIGALALFTVLRLLGVS